LNKLHQKKLFARVFSKQSLSNIKEHSFKDLEQKGVFRNPIEIEYNNSLLPYLYKHSQEITSNDFIIVDKLNDTFKHHCLNVKQGMHKQSLLNEVKRKENLKIKRLEEIQRRKEEKLRKREEILRIKKENELKALKQLIQNELISQMELNDDPQEIFDIDGYHQKAKKACKI